MLDGLLALVERGADLARLGIVGGTGHLGLELGLEWPLGLGEELGAGVGPRRELGGGDGDGRAREVADLDLRLDLRLHEGEDGFIEALRNLDEPLGHHGDLSHLQLVGVLRDGRNQGVVGRNKHKATLGHLVDALCEQKEQNMVSAVERESGMAWQCSGCCRHALSLRLSDV